MKCQAAGCTKKNVTTNLKPGVSCAKCSKAYHFDCAKLTKEAFDNLVKHSLDFFSPKFKSSRRSTIHIPDSARSSSVPLSDPLVILTARLEELKSYTDQQIDRLETAIRDKDDKIKELERKFEEINTQQSQLEHHSLEKNLEVQGLPEFELESPIEAAGNIANAINCSIDPSTIDCLVSRSGSKPVLVIKFDSQTVRNNFLAAGKAFNRSKSKFHSHGTQHKVFVNEQLTPTQKKLLYDTKQFGLANNYSFVWFTNGLIHLKRDKDSRLIIIRSHSQLNAIINHETHLLLPERQRDPLQDQRASTSRQGQ